MIRRLGIPLGTRLEMITQHNNGIWRIWTAIANKAVAPEQYIGSYIELHPDGSAYHVPNDYECIEVMDVADYTQRVDGNAVAKERS